LSAASIAAARSGETVGFLTAPRFGLRRAAPVSSSSLRQSLSTLEKPAEEEKETALSQWDQKKMEVQRAIIREYRTFFAPMEKQFYHPNVRFVDPLSDFRGVDAYQGNVDVIAGRKFPGNIVFRGANIKLHNIVDTGEKTFDTIWTMNIDVKFPPGAEPLEFTGISRYTLDDAGLVVEQRDFWDAINLENGEYKEVGKKNAVFHCLAQLLGEEEEDRDRIYSKDLPYKVLRRSPTYEVRRYPAYEGVEAHPSLFELGPVGAERYMLAYSTGRNNKMSKYVGGFNPVFFCQPPFRPDGMKRWYRNFVRHPLELRFFGQKSREEWRQQGSAGLFYTWDEEADKRLTEVFAEATQDSPLSSSQQELSRKERWELEQKVKRGEATEEEMRRLSGETAEGVKASGKKGDKGDAEGEEDLEQDLPADDSPDGESNSYFEYFQMDKLGMGDQMEEITYRNKTAAPGPDGKQPKVTARPKAFGIAKFMADWPQAAKEFRNLFERQVVKQIDQELEEREGRYEFQLPVAEDLRLRRCFVPSRTVAIRRFDRHSDEGREHVVFKEFAEDLKRDGLLISPSAAFESYIARYHPLVPFSIDRRRVRKAPCSVDPCLFSSKGARKYNKDESGVSC